MRAAGRLGFAIDRSELGLRVAILLVSVGGGGAWPGFEIDHSEPLGSRVAIERAGRRPRTQTRTQKSSKQATRLPGRYSGSPAGSYQPRTIFASFGESSHCLVPKEDTDTAATADAKRMRRSGSWSPARSIAHAKAP